jgi:hypothetical protein
MPKVKQVATPTTRLEDCNKKILKYYAAVTKYEEELDLAKQNLSGALAAGKRCASELARAEPSVVQIPYRVFMAMLARCKEPLPVTVREKSKRATLGSSAPTKKNRSKVMLQLAEEVEVESMNHFIDETLNEFMKDFVESKKYIIDVDAESEESSNDSEFFIG